MLEPEPPTQNDVEQYTYKTNENNTFDEVHNDVNDKKNSYN